MRIRSGQMAFFQQLITNLEHSPAGQQAAQTRGGGVQEVLKYAPRKVRCQHGTAAEPINQLETELKQWRDRACRAETQLRFIEKSIQQIAPERVTAFRLRG